MSDKRDKDLDLPLEDAEIHESQKFNDDTGETPDFLAAPKKGKGVRRLNRVPLIVAFILIMLAVAGIVWTFFDRQAQNIAASKPQEVPTLKATAMPPVRPTGADYVAPYSEPTETPQGASSANPVDTGSGVGALPTDNGGRGAQAVAPVQSEAMKRRLRQIQQLEDKRLAKADEAMYGTVMVEEFNQGSNPSGVQPTAAGAPGANRLNPQEIMQQYLASTGGPGMGGDPSMMGGGMGGVPSMASENGQLQKRAFLSGTTEANTYLAHQKKAAIAPSQEVKAGWVIPGVMISGMNSDLPGQIIGQVREPVYDSATGTQCLIPSGSRLVGIYDSGVTLGQTRALAAWQRIIYPDGSSISLDKMPGADQGGYAGFDDQVNNHYLKIFGAGAMLSIFSAGIQLSQPQASNGENYSSQQTIAGALGQQMGQIGMQMAQRNMNIQPTLEIRPGYEFNIMVTKDILLPTWEGHPMAGANNKSCN